MFAVKQNFVWPHFLFAITHIYLFLAILLLCNMPVFPRKNIIFAY